MIKTKKELFELIEINAGITNVTEEASFIDDLGLDSLDMIELQMTLEEEFDIEIQDEETMKLNKVSDLIEFLKTKNINLD